MTKATNGKAKAKLPHPVDKPAKRRGPAYWLGVTSLGLSLVLLFVAVPIGIWLLLAPDNWTTRAFSLVLVWLYLWSLTLGLWRVGRDVVRRI